MEIRGQSDNYDSPRWLFRSERREHHYGVAREWGYIRRVCLQHGLTTVNALLTCADNCPRRPGRVPAEAHTKGYFARVVDEYLQIGIATTRREQEAIVIQADRSVLLCRPRCSLVDRLKAVAYGIEVVALQLMLVIAHAKPGYGMLLRRPYALGRALLNVYV